MSKYEMDEEEEDLFLVDYGEKTGTRTKKKKGLFGDV
jgi:hypothetical protein